MHIILHFFCFDLKLRQLCPLEFCREFYGSGGPASGNSEACSGIFNGGGG